MIRWATEIKIRAERRVGELLRETAERKERRGTGRPAKNRPDTGPILPKLEDLGISRHQSQDWQKLAAMPEKEFERRVAEAARIGRLIAQRERELAKEREIAGKGADSVAVTPWSWLPSVPWRCPRCGQILLTREAGPVCPRCHYRESVS